MSKTARLKYAELKIKVYLTQEFPETFTHNSRIWLGDCATPYRRFIDFYVMVGGVLVAVEVDERQHKGYSKEDEALRITEILHNIGLDKKMVFIRYNPDAYKVDGKSRRTSDEKRMMKLKETIAEVLAKLEAGEEYDDIHTEIKLFFDS